MPKIVWALIAPVILINREPITCRPIQIPKWKSIVRPIIVFTIAVAPVRQPMRMWEMRLPGVVKKQSAVNFAVNKKQLQ